MKKIVTLAESAKLSQKSQKKGSTVVLVGGCFDILHRGHRDFLANAKRQGDLLFVLLESDENVRKYKGKGRPINSQKDRAAVLSALKSVDYVIMLPQMTKDEEYARITYEIKPNVIAATKNDPKIKYKLKQAKDINAKIVYVIDRIPNLSTTGLIKQNGNT